MNFQHIPHFSTVGFNSIIVEKSKKNDAGQSRNREKV